MPVPEIDRLAHEILDILGRDLPDGERPDFSRMFADGALVTLAREFSEIDSGPQPIMRGYLKSLQAGCCFPHERAAIWDHTARKFKGRPSSAFFRLYAALERAEMQERATPTPDLDADDPSFLASGGYARDDVSRHDGEGTRPTPDLLADLEASLKAVPRRHQEGEGTR